MPSIDRDIFASGEPTYRPAPAAGGWLTPGQVARAAGVTPRTVQSWCDRGLLRCERLPSGHRRIQAKSWVLFRQGSTRAERDAAGTALEPSDALDARIGKASSPQEIIDLLLNGG